MFDKVRADLTIDVQEIKDPADKAAVECLLALDDASLASTLAWLGSVDKTEAQALAGRLADLSPEQLKRFATLSPEQKSILLSHRPNAPEPKPEPKPSLLNSLSERLKAARSGVQQSIEDVRKP
jgi:hypothetical protein